MPVSTIQLIETIRVEPGRNIPLLAGHWQRLENSCTALGYQWPAGFLVDAVQQRVGKLDTAGRYRLRLLLSQDGQYSIATYPLPDTPQPVRLQLSSLALRADYKWLAHKTTHRPWYEEAQSWLTANPGFFDVVYCNDKDEVCEGSRSNIYIQDAEGNWLTPPLDCGLLPGVQRQALLDAAMVQEARISRRQLLDAHAIRVSNALRGWLDATL